MRVAGEGDAAEAVTLPLVNRHTDVDALPCTGAKGEEGKTALIPDMRGGDIDRGPEIAPILQRAANPLGIFLEFAGVVGAGEDVLQEDGVRNSNGPQVFHGRAQLARTHRAIALEGDISHLDGRAFLDDEVDGDR